MNMELIGKVLIPVVILSAVMNFSMFYLTHKRASDNKTLRTHNEDIAKKLDRGLEYETKLQDKIKKQEETIIKLQNKIGENEGINKQLQNELTQLNHIIVQQKEIIKYKKEGIKLLKKRLLYVQQQQRQ